ncbi:type II TA system antitoxin MqsA family protein [Shewanella bicestrii]|nr:type II TA system antitoxin MqsA family protein [Shewanella bicestrii]
MRYKNSQLNVISKFTVCESCGEEFELPEQAAENDIAMREVKKEHDGLLGRHFLKNIRISLGLTQQQAAIVFGGGINSFSKYERGEVTQSDSLDKLVRLCYSDNSIYIKHLELINRLDLAPPKKNMRLIVRNVGSSAKEIADVFISDREIPDFSTKIAGVKGVRKVVTFGDLQYGT